MRKLDNDFLNEALLDLLGTKFNKKKAKSLDVLLNLERELFNTHQSTPIWTPQAGSQELIRQYMLDDVTTEIAVNGNRGGGKTLAVQGCLLELIEKYGNKVDCTYFSELQKDLQRIKEEILKLMGNRMKITGGGSNSNRMKFANGAIIDFSQMNEAAVNSIQGANKTHIIVEEAANIGNLMPSMAMIELAHRTKHNVPLKTVYIYNYTGASYLPLKKKFNVLGHNNPEPIIDYKTKKPTGKQIVNIKSMLAENRILLENQPDYGNRFDNEYLPPSYIAAWRDGDEDQYTGSAFDCLNKANNGIAEDSGFIKRHSLKFIVGIDWGWAADTVATFVAIDKGKAILFDYIVLNRTTPSDVAKSILAKVNAYGRENLMYYVGDPSMSSEHTGTNTIWSMFAQEGVVMINGNNDTRTGYMVLYKLIKSRRLFALAELGKFWDEFPALTIDPNSRYSDCILRTSTTQDHLYDSLRYAVMSLDWNN